MRRLRVVSWSILSARLSLSEVSSSTELDAVLTSMPSFLRRSMTSWLERFRSLASWKTLTFPIRLTPLRPFRHGLAGRLRGLERGRRRRRRRLRARHRVRLRARGGLLGSGLLLGGGLLPGGGLLLAQPPLLLRLLGHQALRLRALGLRALGLRPRRLLRVLAVPFRLGRGGRLPDLLRRLGAH